MIIIRNFNTNSPKAKKEQGKGCRRWLILACICILTSVSGKAQLQKLTEKVTVFQKQTTALKVIEALDKQSNYSFTFAQEQLAAIAISEFTVEHMPLGDALLLLQKKYGLQFAVLGENIMVKPADKPRVKLTEKKDSSRSISGKVVDFENGDPLSGATVRVEGKTWSALTNENGEYVLNKVPVGTYTLVISYVGYNTERIQKLTVGDDRSVSLDIKLQVNNAQDLVVVKAVRRKKVVNTTDQQLVNEIYNARTVVSGISSEQIARSMDRDAAEIVKRIPGVNVSDDRFIVVRGLNKRYNLTFLNDNIAPATELDSRAFSFDLLSSNIIDKIMIYKSPSPELQGEFAGGVVKVTTKRSQLTKQLDIQISSQYRPNSSFERMPDYAGSKTDVLGFDDGTRNLPAGIPSPTDFNLATPAINAQYSKKFKNNYLIRQSKADLDKRVTINYYDAWRLGNKWLNNLTSASYTNTEEFRSTDQQSRFKDNPSYAGLIEQGFHNARISVLQNNNIQLNKQLRIELKQFLNQQGNRVAINDYRVVNGFTDVDQKRTALYFRSTFLYAAQLSGYFHTKDERTKVFANAGYSTIHRNDPDLREVGYTRTRDSNVAFNHGNPKALWMHGSWEAVYPASRYYIDVKEKAYQGNFDIEQRLTSYLSVKTGFFSEMRQRELFTRTFRLTNGVNAYHPDIFIPNPEQGGGTPSEEWQLPAALDTSNFLPDGTGYRWRESTAPNDEYFAQNDNYAGYLSANLDFLDKKLNIFGGLRVEHNRFRILGARPAGQATYPIVVNQPITSWLPSINVNYRPDSTLIIRAGYGKTLNRPEFREAAPFQFYDYISYEVYYGNPMLTTVNINNYDIRFELFPRSMLRNEMINLGFFYKTMDHPIEVIWARIPQFESKFNTFYYANTGPAKIYGIEAEIRKSLAFIPGRLFRDLTVILNGAWIKSEVSSPPLVYPGHDFPRKRPLQGQVPYLINASLNYENPGWGTKVSLAYHRSGDQIYSLGTSNYKPVELQSGFPDIMEKGRHLMDISWSQRLNKYLSLKAGVQNILNAPVTLYQDYTRDYKYSPETKNEGVYDGDVLFRRYYVYPYYSLGFNFIF